MSGDVHSDPVGRRDPVRLGYDVAARIATLAAALCPALASLGGSIVAALLVTTRWCAARHELVRRTDGTLL